MKPAADAHEEFEIASLRRARGALDAAASARLAAHLASCGACRSFAATAEATQAALRGRVVAAAGGRDWDRVRAAFRARRRHRTRATRTGLAMLTAIVALETWAFGPAWGAALGVFALVVLVFGLFRTILPNARRAREAERVDAELLDFFRRDLDHEIEELRRSKPLLPVVLWIYALLVLVTAGLVAKRLWITHEPVEWPELLVPVVVVTGVWVPIWRRVRVSLPRLERERQELAE
jgi:hypothetical protein